MAVLVSRTVRVMIAALLLLAAASAEASTILYRTDAELIALSDRVVHARAIRQRFERPEAGGAIYTVTTLAVLEDFTGVPGLELETWELGGVHGGEIMWVAGQVTYEIGQDVLVCLRRGPLGFRSVGMGFSKFDVSPAGTLTRSVKDTAVLGASSLTSSERTLTEFRDLTEQVRGVPAIRNREAESLIPSGEVAAGFTFLGPYRWTEADSGTPISWYMSNYAPSPLLSGNGVSELQLGLQAWTAPSTASITLQYVGMTNVVGSSSGLPNGTGVITFEDPNGNIDNPTLAVGGGFAFTSGGGTVNGQAFGRFTRGYIIFQNAADLSSAFRQSTNIARVVEHEVGHTIGLGHSDSGQSNVMFSSCCSASTPVAPALGPDDLAGLNFIYPSGTTPTPPPTCTYAISPSTGANAPDIGGLGSVTVTTTPGCAWTASVSSSSTSMLAITGGSSGSGSGTVSYSVTPNISGVTRTGAMTIAGFTFIVGQASIPCSYTVSPASASIAPAGGSSSVTVTTNVSGCAWSATSNDAFLVITSGASGTGAGSISYSVAASSAVSYRVGTMTIGGRTVTVTQSGSGPVMSLDKPSLNFGATTSNAAFVAQTTSQAVRLSQSGTGTVSWVAASNVPWLTVSPSSGIGATTLNVSVANSGALPGAGTIAGAITFTFFGAGLPSGPIVANLSLYHPSVSGAAAGTVDTPANNLTGVTGSIAVTGWAVDDIEVVRVRVLRDPVPGEPAGLVFIGNAVFVDGSRPDVAALFPSIPRRTRAGWGYLLLTNALPNLGDGTFVLHAFADDADGHTTWLGSRTITCTNIISTVPFGAIDTPEPGAVVSGVVNNFGWVLTRGPAIAAPPSGTVTVVIDGVAVGSPTGWASRPDLTALFPAATYPGITSALGIATIDTTRLTNGIHTISWVVTASNGQAAGIGSRYFIVQNAASPSTADPAESPIVTRAGPEVTIDRPAAASVIAAGESLHVSGSAVDRDAGRGTGVGAIHVWAYPAGNGQPMFLGVADLTGSGYELVTDGLPPGTYDIAVFAWSTVMHTFAPARTVRVVVR